MDYYFEKNTGVLVGESFYLYRFEFSAENEKYDVENIHIYRTLLSINGESIGDYSYKGGSISFGWSFIIMVALGASIVILLGGYDKKKKDQLQI
ncbi:MAG: hypothetical protein ACTSU2_00815 [Promethearchaeota archaeon]